MIEETPEELITEDAPAPEAPAEEAAPEAVEPAEAAEEEVAAEEEAPAPVEEAAPEAAEEEVAVLEEATPEAVEEEVAVVEEEVAAEEEAPAAVEAAPEAEEEAAEEAPAGATEETPAVAEEEAVAPVEVDPFGGPGDWYVVHTYAGYENKVKTNLGSRIQSMQMQEKIFHIHIPMEDVMEIKGGKKQVVKKKVFPGYLLVKMIYDNDSWYVVRNTPGVTGFVSSGTGTKPTPLSRKEIDKILVVQKEEVKPVFRLEFEEGDVVRIISGPFADFNGTINEINMDQSKLKVLVNIFDRETPVELGFDQVAKV